MPNVILKSFEETLDAGEYRPIYFYSELLTILSNSASDKIFVGIGELTPVPLKAGLQFKLPQGSTFNKIMLFNQAAVQTTTEFILSTGDVRDNRMSVSGQIDVNDADVLAQLRGIATAGTSGTEKTVGIAAGLVLAANTNRVGFSVQAKEANTGLIYIGFADTVTASAWIAQLQPGMSMSLDNYRGPVYAIASAAGQLLGWGEW